MENLRTPDAWYTLGQGIYRHVLDTFARYGVRVHPDLRFVQTDAPTPYYAPLARTIGFGVPDAGVPSGRLYFYFIQYLVGAADLEETERAMEVPLPWTIAHEVVHHLRHHYGAPISNDFVEEQVVNCVAIALLGEHPAYRDGLPALARWASRIYERMRSHSPETEPYLTGFRLETGDVLVSQGVLTPGALRDARRLADATGAAVEEVLLRTGRITVHQLAYARDERARAEDYFNRRYMSGLREYWLFGTEWLARYLERDDLPTLGDALARYILTDDWEASQREATRLLLEQALGSPDPAIAMAAAPALAELAGAAAIPSLVAALDDPRPPVQAAILDALGGQPGGPEAGAPRARSLLDRADDAIGSAARLLRLANYPIVVTDSASPAVRAEAALARMPDDPSAYDELAALLDGNGASALAALNTLAEAGPGSLSERIEPFLDADDSAIRVAALRALGGSSGAVAAIIARLSDEVREVREAARAVLRQLDRAAWPELARTLETTPDALEGEVLGLVDRRVMPAATHRLKELSSSLQARSRRLERIEAQGAGHAGFELLTQAAGEERRRLARLALRAIGQAIDPGTLELVERAINSPDPGIRSGGRELLRSSLGRQGPILARLLDPAVVASLPAQDPTSGLRAYAVADPPILRALAAHAAPDVLAPAQAARLLQRVASDRCALVREEASAASRRLDSPGEKPMLTTIEKLIFLRSTPTFAECDVETIRRMAACCVVQRFVSGETILREGEPGRHFYIVTEGRVGITLAGRRIDELGPRQYFGEMALFDGGPRSATVTALDATTVLRLDQGDFHRLGREAPDLLIGVIRVLSGRLRSHMARPDRQDDVSTPAAQ